MLGEQPLNGSHPDLETTYNIPPVGAELTGCRLTMNASRDLTDCYKDGPRGKNCEMWMHTYLRRHRLVFKRSPTLLLIEVSEIYVWIP